MTDFKERLARLREQQQNAPKLSLDDIARSISAQLNPHIDHPWVQVGRCVICGPCGVRLYQGTIPDDHVVYVPPPPRSLLTEFRSRWKVTPEESPRG